MPHSITRRSQAASLRSIDSLVATFDEGWERSSESLARFWMRCRGSRPLRDLSALIKVDLRRRFERGERPAASTYLSQFPELAADNDRVLSLVYEEFCLLDEHRANPSVTEFCQRYEPWADSIASQLGYHHRFSQSVAQKRVEVRYPVVGECFASYQLRSILGQGGSAQVYLATDADLGDREVVLKLTPTLGLEPSILASLEHRNIVPIHSVARSEGSVLQGICMPYRPGITLEALLIQLLRSGPPRRARAIWDLLGLNSLDSDQADPAWRDYPIQGTYTEGVAWLGLEMAQALTYLHGRDVHHRDIKPANILLSARGGPLLIDFNLAYYPHTPEQACEAMTGGTLPYMAPEQLQAFLDPEAWETVGPQADIYALGLVLRELVTGIRPALPAAGIPLDRAIADLRDRRPDYAASSRDHRPDLPASLDAIIRKCLAFDPKDRYESAQDLGDDLRLFLQRKPLAAAPNPSPIECGLNWAFRNRQRAFLVTLVCVAIGCAVLLRLEQSRSQVPSAPLLFNPLLRDLLPLPRIVQAVEAHYNALQDPVFLGFLETLRTKPVEEWGTVHEGLKDLKRKHPDSAWPLVYLVQVEQKLIKRSSDRDQWQNEIETKSDAEAASLHCLAWAPNRIPPLITLGRLATARFEYDRARHYFTEALAHQKNHWGIKLELARLANIQGHPDQGMALYIEAIGDYEAKRQQAPLKVRKNLVQLILGQLDDALMSSANPGMIDRAQSLAALAEFHLKAFERQANQANDSGASPLPSFVVELSQGSLASSRAYLAHLADDQSRAKREFRGARRHLGAAFARLRSMPDSPEGIKNPLTRGELLTYVQAVQEELDRRIARSGLTDELARPAPPSPGSSP